MKDHQTISSSECHHCSWIRCRDRHGSVIPRLEANSTYAILIDTRWPQRFKLALYTDNDTTWQSTGLFTTPFVQFDSDSNYSLTNTSSRPIEKVAGVAPSYVPIWGTFVALTLCSMVSCGVQMYLKYGRPLDGELKLKQSNRVASVDVFRGFV